MTPSPHDQWELSTGPFTVQDIVDARVLQKGPKHEEFIPSIIRLIRSRIVDPPGLSEEDVGHLTLGDVADVGQRILDSMVERTAFERAMPSLRRAVDDAHRHPCI